MVKHSRRGIPARAWLYSQSFHSHVAPLPAPTAPPKLSGLQEITHPAELMLRLNSSGPVSYITDGEKRTSARGQVFMATTYSTMVDRGWGAELPEVD